MAVFRNNLEWDGAELRVCRKTKPPMRFADFTTYRDHLVGVARRMGENAGARKRDHPVSLLSTVSRGYDSPAASVLARGAGCSDAVTIRQVRSVLPRRDSSEEIAQELGFTCSVVDREGRGRPYELAFWVADGRAEDQNLAAFDFPGEVTALFSGAYCGVIWDDDEHKHPAVAEYRDRNTLSFCEYRLQSGVIHCPLPYLDYQRPEEILGIMRSPEMEPWSVGGDYDRPIPRRLVEEAGVPREMFGQRKSTTQFEETFSWPYRGDLQRSYADYLRRVGQEVPTVAWRRFLNLIDRNFLLPIEERSPQRFSDFRDRLRGPERWLMNWSNNELADRLADRRGDDTQSAFAVAG